MTQLHINKPLHEDRVWSSRLARRIEEDARRDPIDAEEDAAILFDALNAIRLLIERPDTRFILQQRLLEDLASGDLSKAAESALSLVKANQKRSVECLIEGAQSLRSVIEEKAKSC